MPILADTARKFLTDIRLFSRIVLKRPLYNYQAEVAHAILDSVLHKRGLEFAVLFPRQSGKNEVQSHLEAYLLTLHLDRAGSAIVKAQPTFKPQAINSIRRLETQLDSDWTRALWRKREGYIVELRQASIVFLSTEPNASVVGATASLLLECDEAQDVLEAEWGKKFEPMTAFTNATVALWGTAWTGDSLLAKTIKRLQQLELADGIKRVFIVSPDAVAKENPAFGEFVKKQIAKYGRNHPFVKTQLFNETIDAEGGMFPPARRALMHGAHPRLDAPARGETYAFTLDVAGEDEGVTGDAAGQVEALANPKRDATTLRIVRVVLKQKPPRYETVMVLEWTGARHTAIHTQIAALVKLWRPVYVVADATGVGAGLVSFLTPLLGDRLIPFIFTGPSKSELGWNLIALAESGRFLMYGQTDVSAPEDEHAATWLQQLTHCRYEIIPGPARLMRWGVPDATRDPQTGAYVHDDHLITAALCSVLDEQEWIISTGPATIIQARDPLDDMRKF